MGGLSQTRGAILYISPCEHTASHPTQTAASTHRPLSQCESQGLGHVEGSGGQAYTGQHSAALLLVDRQRGTGKAFSLPGNSRYARLMTASPPSRCLQGKARNLGAIQVEWGSFCTVAQDFVPASSLSCSVLITISVAPPRLLDNCPLLCCAFIADFWPVP